MNRPKERGPGIWGLDGWSGRWFLAWESHSYLAGMPELSPEEQAQERALAQKAWEKAQKAS